MDKSLSLVICRPEKNYRKLAQNWYRLTDEQMVDIDVHHNPPVHLGGLNIVEHLYIYHHTLHAAVHGDDFTKWAREGGRLGGKAQPLEVKRQNALKGIAKMPRTHQQKAGRMRAESTNKYMPLEKKRELARQMREKTSRETLVKSGEHAWRENLGAFGMSPEDRHAANVKGGRAGGRKAYEMGVGLASMTTEERREAGRKGAKNTPREKRVQAGQISARQLWEDPDHPELGKLNAGSLANKQKSLGLPHGKENRVRVTSRVKVTTCEGSV